MEKKYFNILSLSGGGVRGIFQSKYLEKVEELIKSDFNESFCSYFDLITGTSTGAIIAAALALDIPAKTISNIYEEKMATIFKKDVFSYLTSGGRYNQKVLKSELKRIFESKQLRDSKTKLFLTATCLNMYSHKIFTNFENMDEQISLVDAILASTAAPTYFNAVTPESQRRSYVDGGMWANSPALSAILYVNNIYSIPFSKIRVFSVGNGQYSSGISIEDYNKRIVLNPENISTVLDLLFVSQEHFSNTMVNKLLSTENCFDVNVSLREKIGLDDAQSALAILPGLAEKEFEEGRKKVKDFLSVGLKEDDEDSCYTIKDEELIKAIGETGLTSFVPTRNYYKYRKGYDNISSYIATVEKELAFVSVTLTTGVEYEMLSKTIKDLIEKKDVVVTISLLNPENSPLMESTAGIFDYTADELSKKINKSIKKILDLKEELSKENKEKLTLKVHNILPFGSAIILDCEHQDRAKRRIQIETKPYKAPYNGSFAYEITDVGTNEMFKNLYEGYKMILKEGKEVTE